MTTSSSTNHTSRKNNQNMANHTSTITISMLIMLMFSAVTSAEDMSIISFNEEHHARGEQWRTDDEVMTLYDSWLVENKKVYDALGEKEKRFQIFKDNLRYIDEENARPNKTYELGLTQFADLTNEEYKSMYLGTMSDDPRMLSNMSQSDRYAPKDGDILPSYVDWRSKGLFVDVKNQKKCGSCWAFATIATIEAVNKIVTGELISLSEQELVDCDTSYSHGCLGGFINRAYEFVINNRGIDTEADYPYLAKDGICDQYKRRNSKVVSIDGYRNVTGYNEMALKKAVAYQPVALAIDASSKDLQLYKWGIFSGTCGLKLNHAVVVIGYGSESGMDYWIVRNSWGANWGEYGYLRMRRNIAAPAGLCGIAIKPFYPIKTGPNPSNVCKDQKFVCAPGTTCCCANNACYCCSLKGAICCEGVRSCCPRDYPVCNVGNGTCSISKNSPLGVKVMEHILAEPIVGAFTNEENKSTST